MSIGRGDTVKFYFETTGWGAFFLKDEAYANFRNLLARAGFDNVQATVDYGFYDAVTGEARVTGGGFGTEQDCAQLIAGVATNAGIGVSYSASSPVVEIKARASSGYRPQSAIPELGLGSMFGLSDTTLIVGGVAFVVLMILLRD